MMNHQLKKRVRKLIRNHFEKKFKMDYEQTKDMYRMVAIMDELIDKLDYIDLISQDDIDRVKVMEVLVDGFVNIEKKLGAVDVLPLRRNGKNYSLTITYAQS